MDTGNNIKYVYLAEINLNSYDDLEKRYRRIGVFIDIDSIFRHPNIAGDYAISSDQFRILEKSEYIVLPNINKNLSTSTASHFNLRIEKLRLFSKGV